MSEPCSTADASEITLNVGLRVAATQAEGPGWRYALWLQGCPLRCPGCCNPEYLSFEGGTGFTFTQILEDILATQQQRLNSEAPLEGVTFLGGEPFAQAGAVAALAESVREHGLSVLVFTGFELEELQQRHDPATDAFLRQIDVLMDGPYRRDVPETIRRWIGSANQRMHLLSDRYSADDPRWTQPNTLEIRLTADALEINGFPLAAGKSLWAPRDMYPANLPLKNSSKANSSCATGLASASSCGDNCDNWNVFPSERRSDRLLHQAVNLQPAISHTAPDTGSLADV